MSQIRITNPHVSTNGKSMEMWKVNKKTHGQQGKTTILKCSHVLYSW